jgi:hypothetical protein
VADPQFTPVGPTVPAGMTLRADQVMYRTEVFAVVDTTLFTRANSLLAPLVNSRPITERVDSTVLHIARSPDASRLRTNTSAEACLS